MYTGWGFYNYENYKYKPKYFDRREQIYVFKNILIPVSSEFYSKNILKRSAFLAEKFKSNLTIVYIIEEKTLNQTDKLSNVYLTSQEISETKKEIISKQKLAAYNIIFNDAKFYFKDKGINFKEKIAEGEFSIVVKKELKSEEYDLIVMGFEKECVLNYRLFDEVNIPIWTEANNEIKNILAVCSNLAPNQKVPDFSIKFAKFLGWNLNMIYIVDIEDSVQVDTTGKRSEIKTSKSLMKNGRNFVKNIKEKNINIKLVKGNLEKEIFKEAKKSKADLIIIGREKKQKGILGLPVKRLKQKIAKKCDYSILFIN